MSEFLFFCYVTASIALTLAGAAASHARAGLRVRRRDSRSLSPTTPRSCSAKSRTG
jgi:hypothetical protein